MFFVVKAVTSLLLWGSAGSWHVKWLLAGHFLLSSIPALALLRFCTTMGPDLAIDCIYSSLWKAGKSDVSSHTGYSPS